MRNNPLCDLYKKEPNAAECFLRKPRPNEKKPLAIKKGLAQYIYLISRFNEKTIDVPTDKNFQTVYKVFFDLRYGEGFKKPYYKYMQDCMDVSKNARLQRYNENLKTVLNKLYEETERTTKREKTKKTFEPVFGSKLLSMLYQKDLPPWDSKVEDALTPYLPYLDENPGKKIPDRYKDKKKEIPNFDEWDRFYERIYEWYKDFVDRQKRDKQSWLEQFDEWFKKDWNDWHTETVKRYEAKVGRMKRKNITKPTKPVKAEEIVCQWFIDTLPDLTERSVIISDVKVIDLILWQRGYFPFECSHNK